MIYYCNNKKAIILGLLVIGAGAFAENTVFKEKITPPEGFEWVGKQTPKTAPRPVFQDTKTETAADTDRRTQTLAPEDGPDPRPFTPPRHYICQRAEGALAIDGRLDDAAWSKALWSEMFTDIRAMNGAAQPAPVTKFKMIWDDEYLYVAVYLSEYNLRANDMKRDNPDSTDFDLEMYVDANADNQQYSLLKINPYNALQSVIYNKPPKDGGFARLWPIQGLTHAVFAEGTINEPSDTDKGWTVEMAIPLAMPALLGNVSKVPANGTIWRMNFARVEWRSKLILSTERGAYKPEDLAAMEKLIRCCWSPQGVMNMHRPETWGYIQFSNQPAGTEDAFDPDPTEWARYELHRVLYAQKWYYLNFGSYADSLNALGLDSTPPMFAVEPISITVGPDSFVASVKLRMADMSYQTLSINQDSKLTVNR